MTRDQGNVSTSTKQEGNTDVADFVQNIKGNALVPDFAQNLPLVSREFATYLPIAYPILIIGVSN